MRNALKRLIPRLVSVLALSSVALAQTTPSQKPVPGQNNTLMQKLQNAAPTAPAPKRELTGAWAGAIFADTNPVPPMTPLGQKLFSANKSVHIYSVVDANDPLNTCDPLGFPRDVLDQTRGMMFAQMPDRMLELHQYNRTWREIFTDGRELPKGIGQRVGQQVPGPWKSTFTQSVDPKWEAYSVGRWDGDYSFVVESVGSDSRSWLDISGHPHSLDLHVEERYKRLDHDTMELTVTIDDPEVYTKPFVIATSTFKWIPSQEFEEQICVPSEQEDYLKYVADPAGNGK